MKSICISCKFFKVKDVLSGYCRIEATQSGDRVVQKPLVQHEDSCPKWIDCGQQYYIRLGWLKAQKSEKQTSC